ncbi:MAG TPA: hypothetical protein VFQ22_12635 [Longimicrobiales bacterium]|nr:hypothetical protein [Longimicrobiales bacterium]
MPVLIGRRDADAERSRDVAYEWNVEAFSEEGRRRWLQSGFWERELARRTEEFGNVAHVLSSYDSRVGSEESAPVARGVNSIQLLRYGGRWWIESIVWDLETPALPLPADLAGGATGAAPST